MTRYWLSTVSHNTILARLAPLTGESYRDVMTAIAKRLGIGR